MKFNWMLLNMFLPAKCHLMIIFGSCHYCYVLQVFIHSGDLYSTSSRHYYSEVLPAQTGLEGDVKFGRGGYQQGTQLNREIIPGRWAHNILGLPLESAIKVSYNVYCHNCDMYVTGYKNRLKLFFTGYLFSSGLYFVYLPWSGRAFWALLRPTSEIFAISP